MITICITNLCLCAVKIVPNRDRKDAIARTNSRTQYFRMSLCYVYARYHQVLHVDVSMTWINWHWKGSTRTSFWCGIVRRIVIFQLQYFPASLRVYWSIQYSRPTVRTQLHRGGTGLFMAVGRLEKYVEYETYLVPAKHSFYSISLDKEQAFCRYVLSTYSTYSTCFSNPCLSLRGQWH